MGNQRETNMLNRILSLEWQGRDDRKHGSQLALFNEFLRRVGVWCNALNWQDAHPIASDLPGRVVPGVRATPVNATLMQQTLRTLGKTTVYERMVLTHALNWSAIADEPAVSAFNLPDPYEPLVQFYERGGWLDKPIGEAGWEISGVIDQIDRAVTYCNLEPLMLDPDLLDQLDEEVPT